MGWRRRLRKSQEGLWYWPTIYGPNWWFRYEKKLRDEGRAQGHAQGHTQGRAAERVEVNKHWRAWNRRRREAEARGASFDEPEPYSDDE